MQLQINFNLFLVLHFIFIQQNKGKNLILERNIIFLYQYLENDYLVTVLLIFLFLKNLNGTEIDAVNFVIFLMIQHLYNIITCMNEDSSLLESAPQKLLNNNKSKKIVLVATLISLIILVAVNLPNLNPSPHAEIYSHVVGSSEAINGNRTRPKSAVLIKDPKQIENAAVKIPRPDRKSTFMSRFTLDGPSISYNGPNQKWTQLLGFKPIPHNETYKIKMLLTFSANNHIMFGITNSERITAQSSFYNEDTYTYYGNNGCLWAEGELMLKDGIGYGQKQIVEVDVQLWEGLIQWKVNGAVRWQVFSQNLKNKNVSYVPYLEMFEKDDQVRMME